MESPKPQKDDPTWSQKWNGVIVLIGICLVLQKASTTSLWRGTVRMVNPDDKRDIQGKWVVMAEEGGKPGTVAVETKRVKIVVGGESIQGERIDGALFPIGSFSLDPARKAIDIAAAVYVVQAAELNAGMEVARLLEGKVVPGIYELSTDRLVLCLAIPGQQRPKDLNSTSANRHLLLVLEHEAAYAVLDSLFSRPAPR